MNSFPFLLIHPDFTIVMLSMIGFHLVCSLHQTAFFLSGHSGQDLEHQGILAGTVICRLGSSRHGVLLDYLLVIKYASWRSGGRGGGDSFSIARI